jgi:L,D-transpeptidase catalytic domain/Putative peptidoglycan binding domain
MPALAAGFVLAVVVGVGVVGNRDRGSEASNAGVLPTDASTTTAVLAPSSTVVAPPAATVPKTTFAASIAMGASGDDVRQLQQRLTDLGFQPGPIDGVFGGGTQQAVWAYKKLVGNVEWETFSQLDDQTLVTNELWQQMQEPTVQIMPRRPAGGTHVEVYLPLQVLAVFTDNAPVFVSHISSGQLKADGSPATFCEKATYDTDEYGNPYPEPVTKEVCAESKTPGGVFDFERYYDGQRVSPLGGMKNPWYFNFGIAIHGAQNIPTSPASHGCIRISGSLADVFPTLVDKGDDVYVWGHDGKEPEQYTERESLPSFNRPDPDATTTTTSTTTIPTTTVPPTTAPPTTRPATTLPATTVAPTTVAPTTTTPPTTTVPPAAP